MAIIKPNVLTDVAAAFNKQLPEFVWAQQALKQGYVGAMGVVPALEELGRQGDPNMLHDALPIFTLSLQDVANNAGTSAAVPAGWRIFAGSAEGRIVVATLTRKVPSQGWKITASYYGDRVFAVYQAILALEQLEQIHAADFELRMLIVPGLNLEAFWLKTLSATGADLIVPFPPMPNQPIEELNREPVYSMANLLAAIRPLARLRLTAEAKYGG